MKPYYQDESVTIYQGDCREILPNLSVADAVVTDPPFKLSQAYSANVDADNLDAVASTIDVARLLRPCVKPGGVAAVFYDNRIMPFGLEAWRRAGWRYLRFLNLYRRWGNAHKMHGWMSTSDPVFVFANPGAEPKWGDDWNHDTYVKANPEQFDIDHPAQKPVTFVQQIVRQVCPEDGLVLDPYMGSGTALVAARAEGRRAIGIELEERYCAAAVQRLAQRALAI